ncbi:transglycosylase SLT domain-containing protein [Nocardia sp. NPDC049220]|uniref:transglycosylase SLT domain-containing protein n=1 Tax=Nocardia sp. NPDC049220 TaxID=3155273 RepID=UPI0033F4B1B1
MPDIRFSSFRRPSLRESIAVAFAAAGVVAVAASSAVSVADDSVPSRIAMVAEEQPAASHVAEAALAVPAPAAIPAPMPIPAPPAVPAPIPAPMPPPAPAYADNLDGWIRQALDVMRAHNIPGTYEGIHRNIMRESTGNPQAINLWDSNAAMGIPSKGLLQVIDPTFATYHVEGTSWDIWDPVANIAAACNYAAQRYGSMDYVDSAY